MSESASATVEPASSVQARNKWFGGPRLFWLALVVVFVVYAQTRFWQQPSAGDRANWDYMAQVIARGGVPYRDVVNIKSPLSAYIGAAAIVTMRPFALRDILAIRLVFILLAATTVALTFLVTLDYFDDLRTALLAATILLAFRPFLNLNSGGIQPKTPMILFGLLTLGAILKDRPLRAGVAGMLSALSWQPGLLFVGAAGLAFSRYLTRWRDMRAANLIAGASIPLLVTLGYFWLAGALKDLYLWTIDFNFRVYAPGQARAPVNILAHLAKVVVGGYGESLMFFYLAIAGLLVTLWNEAIGRNRLRRIVSSAHKHAIIIAPVVYLLFCMVDLQGPPDLIPLVPFIAAFGAVAIMFVVKREANLILRLLPKLDRKRIEDLTGAAIIALIFFLAVRGLLSNERGFPKLEDQDLEVGVIVSQLQPGDKIFVHGRTEILVLSGMTNVSKHFFFDRGKDNYLDSIEAGGFDGWLERLKAERPKIVVLDRLATVDRVKDFEDWVRQEYEPRQMRIFEYWIRKGDQN